MTVNASSGCSVDNDLYPNWNCNKTPLLEDQTNSAPVRKSTFHSGLAWVIDLCCLENCVFYSIKVTFENSLDAYFRDFLLVLKTNFNCSFFNVCVGVSWRSLHQFWSIFSGKFFDKELASFPIYIYIYIGWWRWQTYIHAYLNFFKNRYHVDYP